MRLRIQKLQWARRAAQFSVLGILLIIPGVARYSNYLAARELDDNLERWAGSPQGVSLAAVDAAFRALPEGETDRAGVKVRNRSQVLTYAQQLRGGPWSVQIGGLSITDPLGVAESVVARKQVSAVLLISLIVPLVGTVLFGRVFCSWLCPMGLLLEFTDKLRGLLRFLEIKPQDIGFSTGTKYMLLATGLVMAAVFAVPVLGYIYPPAIVSREAHDLVFGLFDRAEAGSPGLWLGGLTWMSLILGGIVLFEVIVTRRWWCRYVCPGGALYGLLGAARPLRVKLNIPRCSKCAECVKVCPMGLNPMQNKMGMECDNCGVCISHCPDGALNYGLTIRSEGRPDAQTNPGITLHG